VIARINHDLPHLAGHRLQLFGMDRILRQVVRLVGIGGQVVKLVVIEAVVDELPVSVPQQPLADNIASAKVFGKTKLLVRGVMRVG